MTSKRNTVGLPAPARLLARGLLAAWPLLGTAFPVAAADVPIYQAVVPLTGTTEADRASAFGEALKTAAIRASGRMQAANSPRIVAAAAEPSAFVQQYSTTADRMLKVGFDARAMDQLVAQAGLPLWPAERPAVAVYLFLPGVAGGSRAVMADERVPERVAAERAAQVRGLPLLWPTEAISVAEARARVTPRGATLVGSGAGASIDWSFAHAGQGARAQGDAAVGVNLAGDRLAERYAPASTRATSKVTLRVGGLAGLRDYAELSRYLEELSLVRDVQVRELSHDSVEFELAVRGDLDLLARIFALDGRLVRAAGEDAAGAGSDFLWRAT